MISADLALGLLGAALAAATFFIGRLSAARTTGAEWGSLKTDISHIKRSMEALKHDVRRLDERLDEHMAYHAAL